LMIYVLKKFLKTISLASILLVVNKQ
jgi:hypothetical protein